MGGSVSKRTSYILFPQQNLSLVSLDAMIFVPCQFLGMLNHSCIEPTETSYFSVHPTSQALTNSNSQILLPAHYGVFVVVILKVKVKVNFTHHAPAVLPPGKTWYPLRWYYYMTQYKRHIFLHRLIVFQLIHSSSYLQNKMTILILTQCNY